MVGDLLAVQLKGVESMKWIDDGPVRKGQTPPIKTSTARYWLGLSVPVFVFVVDLTVGRVFFTQAQHSLRRQYGKLETQKTLSLPIRETDNLSNDGLVTFTRSYLMQKGFASFCLYSEEVVSHALDFAHFIKRHRGSLTLGR